MNIADKREMLEVVLEVVAEHFNIERRHITNKASSYNPMVIRVRRVAFVMACRVLDWTQKELAEAIGFTYVAVRDQTHNGRKLLEDEPVLAAKMEGVEAEAQGRLEHWMGVKSEEVMKHVTDSLMKHYSDKTYATGVSRIQLYHKGNVYTLKVREETLHMLVDDALTQAKENPEIAFLT